MIPPEMRRAPGKALSRSRQPTLSYTKLDSGATPPRKPRPDKWQEVDISEPREIVVQRLMDGAGRILFDPPLPNRRYLPHPFRARFSPRPYFLDYRWALREALELHAVTSWPVREEVERRA